MTSAFLKSLSSWYSRNTWTELLIQNAARQGKAPVRVQGWGPEEAFGGCDGRRTWPLAESSGIGPTAKAGREPRSMGHRGHVPAAGQGRRRKWSLWVQTGKRLVVRNQIYAPGTWTRLKRQIWQPPDSRQ